MADINHAAPCVVDQVGLWRALVPWLISNNRHQLEVRWWLSHFCVDEFDVIRSRVTHQFPRGRLGAPFDPWLYKLVYKRHLVLEWFRPTIKAYQNQYPRSLVFIRGPNPFTVCPLLTLWSIVVKTLLSLMISPFYEMRDNDMENVLWTPLPSQAIWS